MNKDQIQVGETYAYFPPKENADDNRHFPAKVEAIGKRIKVRLFMEGHPPPEGVIRHVSAKSIELQHELL